PEHLQEVVFDRYPGPDAGAKMEALTASAFGSRQDAPVQSPHDAAVQAASARARERLPALKTAFQKGLPLGERILLKAGFPIPEGGTEWMWIEVSAWQGTAIRGSLQNAPTRIPTLKAGQTVAVSEAQIADYIHHHADGKDEGNLTRPALESGH